MTTSRSPLTSAVDGSSGGRKRQRVADAEDIEDAEVDENELPVIAASSPHPPVNPPAKRRRRPGAGEKFADLRADLISLKTKGLLGRKRLPLLPAPASSQPRQGEANRSAEEDERDEPGDASFDAAPLSSRAGLSPPASAEADLPPGRPRYFCVSLTDEDRLQAAPKQGYLVCHSSAQLVTIELFSSSHQPVQQSVFPAHRCPELRVSSLLCCEPLSVHLQSELTASEYQQTQRAAEEQRAQKREKGKKASRGGGEVGAAELERGIIRAAQQLSSQEQLDERL